MTSKPFPPEAPRTWSELMSSLAASPGGLVMDFNFYHKRFSVLSTDSPYFGPSFLEATEVVIGGCLAGQDEVMRALWGELEPRARRICEEPGLGHEELDTPNLAALGVFALQEAAGWADPPAEGIGRMIDRLCRLLRFGDHGLRMSVWAALAFASPDDIGWLAEQGPIPDGEEEIHKFQLLLAQALDGGPRGGVEASWRRYLDAFPPRESSGEAGWSELLWAARCVHVRLGGGSPEGLVAWLRSEIGWEPPGAAGPAA